MPLVEPGKRTSAGDTTHQESNTVESNTAKIIITVPQNTPARDIDAFSFVAVDLVRDDFGEDTEVEINPADAPLSVTFEGDVAKLPFPNALQTELHFLLASLQDTLLMVSAEE